MIPVTHAHPGIMLLSAHTRRFIPPHLSMVGSLFQRPEIINYVESFYFGRHKKKGTSLELPEATGHTPSSNAHKLPTVTSTVLREFSATAKLC